MYKLAQQRNQILERNTQEGVDPKLFAIGETLNDYRALGSEQREQRAAIYYSRDPHLGPKAFARLRRQFRWLQRRGLAAGAHLSSAVNIR